MARSSLGHQLSPFPVYLFLPVFLGVSLHGLFAVMSGVSCVRPRCVGIVCGLLIMPAFVMLSRFGVVAGSMCVMF